MNNLYYPYLHDYILSEASVSTLKPKELGKLRHNFFPLQADVIQEVLTVEPFPAELKQFYREIGFGYFHCNKERVNRILDPYSLIMTNRLEDRFAFDIELKRSLVEEHLVFFQTFLYQFLTIERETIQGTNAVYYRKQKIAGSLREFLSDYQNNRDYLQFEIRHIDEAEIKKGIPQASLRNTFVYKTEDSTAKKSSLPVSSVPEEKNTTPVTPEAPNPSKKKWTVFLDDDDSFLIG